MNNLVRLSSLPDELSNGYMGRLARANGFDAIPKFDQFLDVSVRCGRSRHGLRVSRVEALSEVAGMSLQSYLKAHTMLSLWQGVVGAEGGLDSERNLFHALQAYGTRASRSLLYYCPECAKADVAFHGMSYWRREHQLAGVYGCSKHERPLACAPLTSVIDAPAMIGDDGALCTELFELSETCEAIQRARDLAHGLLHSDTRRSTEEAFQSLRPHLRAAGIDGYTYLATKSTLFELIFDTYPWEWIRSSFADDQLSAPDQLFREFAGRFVPVARPSAFWVLVLATAAVVESSDEAMNLWSPNTVPQASTNQRVTALQSSLGEELLQEVQAFSMSGLIDGLNMSGKGENSGKLIEFLRSLATEWLMAQPRVRLEI